MQKDDGPITIIGLGSIGTLVATAAAWGSSAPVNVVARSQAVSDIRKNGLFCSGALGNISAPASRLHICESLSKIPDEEQAFILIAVKANQVADIADDLATRSGLIGRATRIVLFQNGWGVERPFSALVNPDQILRALVTTGADLVAPGHSHVNCHVSPIAIGHLHGASLDPARRLAGILTAGGFPSNAVSDISRRLWQKLLCNIAVNAAGSAFGMTIGELAANAVTRNAMDILIAEAWCAMESEGYSAPQRTLAEFQHYFYTVFVPVAQNHRSSMERDFLTGRKTEIDFLNGEVVRIAERHGWVAGLNQLFCGLITDRCRLAKAA